MPLYTVEPDWAGETVVVMGAGPSLEETDFAPIRAAQPRVVVINTAWRFWPDADLLFSGDFGFFEANRDLGGFHGPMIACCHPRVWLAGIVTDPRVRWLLHGDDAGLATDRDTVNGRWTSLSQLLSFLAHRAAAKIVLLGIDMQPGADGRRRAGMEDQDTPDAIKRYRRMVSNLATMVAPLAERGVRVINASPRSALDLWPRMDLCEALAC